MLFLTASDVRQALPMNQAIAGMKRAFAALSGGRAEVPQRARLPIPAQEAVSLCMPAYDIVIRSIVVVDSRFSSLIEAGDLIQPIEAGKIIPEHIHAELGKIVLGDKEGRTSATQVTFFKSVGVAVQDIAAAYLALQNALAMGLRQRVEW